MTHGAITKNEAELQARLEARIRKALPLLPAQIKLERYLHLRLGHQAIVIDGFANDRDEIRGRYDVLVVVEDKPLLIAELKASDVDVGEDDFRQVQSYARLHEPMVPLMLVTNGANTLLRRTYDGAELKAAEVAADRLISVLAAAASLAASNSEDAVRTLLGTSRDAWGQILSAWSGEAVDALTGGVRDFERPIAREFLFERQAAKDAVDCLDGGSSVLVVYGPPLSGVTNVLAQISRSPALGPSVFINGKEISDILQSIANRLCRELSFGVSKDDIRAWLNTVGGLMGVTLVVDGLPRDGVDEIIENASEGLLRLVLGIDSETFRVNSTVSGRNQKSRLGRVAIPIKLQPLDDVEFQEALDVLDKTYNAQFFNGAQHSPQLRWPRALRIVAATLPTETAKPAGANGRASKLMIAPIPGPMFFERCSRAFAAEPSLKNDLRTLAKAYLEDVNEHATELDWMVATWGLPSVEPTLLERKLGEARLERLRAQGFLSWIDTEDLGPRVLVRVEELLCHHVADEWSVALAKNTDRDALIAEIDHLIHISAAIPAGEVALAAAIIRASQKNQYILSVAIPMLAGCEPTTSKIHEGANLELLAKDARIHLNFSKGMDKETVGNMQPWLVLSHLASWPIEADGHDTTANFFIFKKLGVWRHLLYQPPAVELAQVPGFHVHEVDGVGSVPCLMTGIVEPLLQAMLAHAHSHPDELIKLAQYAMEKKEAYLAWRVLTVALAAESSADEAVERASTQIAKVLKEWWDAALDAAIHGGGYDGST